jgi:hypothetical protein
MLISKGKPKVYLESSTISYLTARPTEEPIRKAKQILTRQWWEYRERFDFFISQTVLDEIEKGDPQAAAARLKFVRDIPRLEIDEAIKPLAKALLRAGVIPVNEEADAEHIAYSAIYGMHFLITWNQRHIATNVARRKIDAVLLDHDCRAPRLLTPEQHLLTMEDENVYYT